METTDPKKKYSHLEPWIEIWDRGRAESAIDEVGACAAHAAPKVVDGNITKVIVTKSGTGYVDPVACACTTPKHNSYWDPKSEEFRRIWRCTYRRMNINGEYEKCNHVYWGMYPPERCPGETDATLPYDDENGTLIIPQGDEYEKFMERHNLEYAHAKCGGAHLDGRFINRRCWGTKTSFELLDEESYRFDVDNTLADQWEPLSAEVSVISEDGRIIEIEVDKTGRDYFASKIVVEGSGTGVDAIPCLMNLELTPRSSLMTRGLKTLSLLGSKDPWERGRDSGSAHGPGMMTMNLSLVAGKKSGLGQCNRK